MTKYGYIRVSSKDQKPERQVEALLNYGIEKENIFTDYMSGKSLIVRRIYSPVKSQFVPSRAFSQIQIIFSSFIPSLKVLRAPASIILRYFSVKWK